MSGSLKLISVTPRCVEGLDAGGSRQTSFRVDSYIFRWKEWKARPDSFSRRLQGDRRLRGSHDPQGGEGVMPCSVNQSSFLVINHNARPTQICIQTESEC